MPEELTFKQEYIRAASTRIWHVTRGGGITLCGRRIAVDLERSWPGFNTKKCSPCLEKKKGRS